MGAVDYSPAEVERGLVNGQAAGSQRDWRFPTNVGHVNYALASCDKERTDQPISTANYALSINHVVAESEHIEFPFLDDNEHVHPSLAPRSLARGFIILFTAQHPLLCPWRTEEREFFICDTNGRIR